MKTRGILSLVFLTAFFLESLAQLPASDTISQPAGNSTKPSLLPVGKLHVGVQAGTQFFTSSGYGSGFSTYVSPTLTYPLSKRFVVSGGISIVNTSLYGAKPYYSIGEWPSYTGNFTQATAWVSGQYLLNDHLTITGTAFKTFDIIDQNPLNSRFYKSNPQGAYFNVGYKINPYMQIEAGFGYTRGDNGYFMGNPGYHGFGSSLYDPFFNR
jgi:hypothetical protein